MIKSILEIKYAVSAQSLIHGLRLSIFLYLRW